MSDIGYLQTSEDACHAGAIEHTYIHFYSNFYPKSHTVCYTHTVQYAAAFAYENCSYYQP